ncbi:hypothetical protein BRADI_4g00218v3 [Brachypodium distachyon]|uniref:Uncharacterized protein n=1 Tax=Brachypodium distachyon TaxID=15368 RepID=A0A0Q3GXA4_BRADI|nr:hypothetical protein BRADI_4g00218v3 [Brachypodium distachyon]
MTMSLVLKRASTSFTMNTSSSRLNTSVSATSNSKAIQHEIAQLNIPQTQSSLDWANDDDDEPRLELKERKQPGSSTPRESDVCLPTTCLPPSILSYSLFSFSKRS